MIAGLPGGKIMDIAAMSTILSKSKLQEDVSILVLNKAMDVAKQNGKVIDELISESSVGTVESHLGSIIDKYV